MRGKWGGLEGSGVGVRGKLGLERLAGITHHRGRVSLNKHPTVVHLLRLLLPQIRDKRLEPSWHRHRHRGGGSGWGVCWEMGLVAEGQVVWSLL